MKLASFVVTCNRPQPTLLETLASLRDAGFGGPTLVCEPGTVLPYIPGGHFAMTSHVHMGPWGALRKAIEIGLGPPLDAEWIVQFQDDIKLAAGTRDWLISEIDSGRLDGCGAASLYCNSAHSDEAIAGGETGWITIPPDDLPRRAYGALALVFSAESARMLLADPPNPTQKIRCDLNVGTFCKLTGRNFLVHCPSLCQHCGTTSVAHPTGELNYLRTAKHFVTDVSEIEGWKPKTKQATSTPA
jgi:hypothetical protein